jgi:hypothetical protein
MPFTPNYNFTIFYLMIEVDYKKLIKTTMDKLGGFI